MHAVPDATDRLGIRPAPLYIVDPALAARVAAPAYDALPPGERGALTANDPLSFLNVLRTPDDGRVGLRTALRSNSAALEQMLRNGVFSPGSGARFGWYRMTVGDHTQTGLIGEVPVADYDSGRILPHEHTRAESEQQLATYLEVVAADASPVSLAYRADDRLRALTRHVTSEPPLLSFTSADEVTHTLWTTEDSTTIGEVRAAAGALGRFYITDGHHRFAAAAHIAAANRVAGQHADAPDQWLLAALFPHDELRILPFHRAVRRPRATTTDQLLDNLRSHVDLRPLSAPRVPDEAHTFTCYLDGRWFELTVPSTAIGAGPLDSLDVVTLQQHVLAPVLGVTEPRFDPRLSYIAGGIEDVVARCEHTRAVGFLVRATTMEQLIAVSEAELVMPPKSTRFDPKPRAGIVLRLTR